MFGVIPAKAGTHNHRIQLLQKLSPTAVRPIGRGVWVP
jgi:hypothetical protein